MRHTAWLPLLVSFLGIALPCDASGQASQEISPKEMIAKWMAAGTAAGNQGDFYDNRDGGHSRLDVRLPGLARVQYKTKEERRRRGWGLQTRILPHVTFGNSSTAGPRGGNGRICYCVRQLLVIAYLQYTGNNLYVYPEHADHDADGKGDLLPTNTPYMIISQGSSGSDKAFIRAVGYALAGFHPEVKKRLVKSGLLMPTVQMIFRMSNFNISGKQEYLSGKAHPTVFQGKDVDLVKMIEAAHGIKADEIPPMVQLKAIEEDLPVQGRDYFESVNRSEAFADTQCVVARIFRGHQYERRMIVSAEQSYDINDRPLTFHWVVLRGDPDRIRIIPKNPSKSVVELRIPYHPRREIRWEPKIHSNRVDIGVFVHNGVHYSAPGFVTYFSLANERRKYLADGRIKEIDYTAGDYVDRRLTDRKPWRDVYEYSSRAEYTGWARYHPKGGIEQFLPDGRQVLKRDTIGRPVVTAEVEYRGEPDTRYGRRLKTVRKGSPSGSEKED